MKNRKKLTALLIAVVMIFTLSLSAFAAVDATGFEDVSTNAWYAEGVAYCKENNLMGGVGGNHFAPEGEMTRAMLATVLYRQAGSPAVTGEDAFSDTVTGSWYANAVLWASQQGLANGYGNGLFGTNDPVTREQLATIFWRYAGSPAAEAGENFADEASISSFAATAVDWARANGIVNGMTGNRFAPKDTATRGQVAVILMNYAKAPAEPTPEPTTAPSEGGKVLVAYFSATNTTESVAQHIVTAIGTDTADLYEITPETPYTSDDLNWHNSNSRTTIEMNDPNSRPAITGSVSNMEQYDVVFLGYPIWWGEAPHIIRTFLESYDFRGKTIVPFCTSNSSGIGSSDTNLHTFASGADWLSGRRFASGTSQTTVKNWVDGLDRKLENAPATTPSPAPSRRPSSSGGSSSGRPSSGGSSTPTPTPTPDPATPTPDPVSEGHQRVLVAYFSGSGTTKGVAERLVEALGSDKAVLHAITPVEPYTTADLDYTNSNCRSVTEQHDPDARPAIANCVANMDSYDIVFLGYPIWNNDAPRIIYTYLEREKDNLEGKTVVPFCTSGGSSITNSVNNIKGLAPDANWLNGRVCNGSNGNASALTSWANGLGLDFSPRPAADATPTPAPADPAPTHEHAWASNWANNTTHHWHECGKSGCPITADAGKDGYAEHSWDSGTETTAPTVDTEGMRTYRCTICAATKTEPIGKLPPEQETTQVLVAYFSCTNTTEGVAQSIVNILGTDTAALFAIIPAVPYTSADLNDSNNSCRANQEQNDPNVRPEIVDTCTVENMEEYDVIFLGYPIWWGQAPKIIYTFLENYDFSGKTIVPFCTSASSGIGSSATNLHNLAKTATWKNGQRFASGASPSTVKSWIDDLGLELSAE